MNTWVWFARVFVQLSTFSTLAVHGDVVSICNQMNNCLSEKYSSNNAAYFREYELRMLLKGTDVGFKDPVCHEDPCYEEARVYNEKVNAAFNKKLADFDKCLEDRKADLKSFRDCDISAGPYGKYCGILPDVCSFAPGELPL